MCTEICFRFEEKDVCVSSHVASLACVVCVFITACNLFASSNEECVYT